MKKIISSLAITGASLLTISIPSYSWASPGVVQFSVTPNGIIETKSGVAVTFYVSVKLDKHSSSTITGVKYSIRWDTDELITNNDNPLPGETITRATDSSDPKEQLKKPIPPNVNYEVGKFTFVVKDPTPFYGTDDGKDFFISQDHPTEVRYDNTTDPYRSGDTYVKVMGEHVDVREAPEPLAILGTGVVLGALPVLKKKYDKSNKKKDEDA